MAKKNLRQRGGGVETDVDMDMTPMIDIVFQMILFFIIITDFTQQEIALLELPWSTVGIEDEGEDTERITINITTPMPSNPDPVKWPAKKREQASKIMFKGKYVDSFGELYEMLEGYGKKNFPEEDKPHLSRRSVLVRCDRRQAFDYVKFVLQICADPKIAIYKIELATAEKAHEQPVNAE